MNARIFILTGRGARIILLTAVLLFYITVGASFAWAQGFSVGYTDREFTGSPGDRFTSSLQVTNITEEAVGVRAYIGDLLRIEGQTSYILSNEASVEIRSLGAWTSFSPDQLVLAPQETKDIYFEITIPDDQTLEGSYWCVIFIEGLPIEEAEISEEDVELTLGLRTIFRYAINIYTTIEGTESRLATFTNLVLSDVEGGFDAIATMQDDGNIYLIPKVWLELRNAAGDVVYTQEHREQMVLPESARDFVFELRDLPIESGEYLVMIIADYGVQGLIAAQGRVNLTITPPAPEDAVDTSGVETEESVVPEEGESGATGEGSPSG